MSDLPHQIENEQWGMVSQQVKGLEETLREHGMDFRKLADHAPIGVFIDDAEGKAIYINETCARMVGVPAEDALRFNWIPFLHPDDREPMVSAWKQSFESSSPFRMEYRWVHADGKVVWTLGECVPILDDEGKAKLFFGSLTDITPQKEAEILQRQL